MKASFLILLFSVFAFTACGQSANKNNTNTQASEKTTAAVAQNDVVNVYYFHGKQRCVTCIAVGKVAKQTVESAYAGNKDVKFIEIDTSDKNNAAIVEKYEVTWNALIIDKEGNPVDITKQAFANAINNPDVLSKLIKTEIDKRLE